MKNRQNANREKKNHFKNGKHEDSALEKASEDAARLGCEIWEVEQKLKEEEENKSEENEGQEEQKINEVQQEEEATDSDDEELERLYGIGKNNK